MADTLNLVAHASPLAQMGPLLLAGDFVRVRADHPDHTRAGKDGLVVEVDGDTAVLTFKFDRSNRLVPVISAGVESWDLTELDLTSVDRSTPLTAATPMWQRIRQLPN